MRCIIKISIILTVLFGLFFCLAFCLGCKEKAEAEEDVWLTTDSNEPVEPENKHILELTADYEITTQEPNYLVVELWDKTGWYINKEDSDILVTNRRRVEIIKPYVITKQEPGYLRVDEPNEPEPSVVEFQCSCGCWYKVIGYDLCYSQKYSVVTDVPKSMKYSLPIPTWPDYIILENDLYIEIPIEVFGPIETRTYVYRKGTRIYFKE